jgi:nucleotide sugar dehydrogenase
MKVCVIGLGTVGTPTNIYMHQQGLQVCGYDILEKSLGEIETYTNWNKVPNSDAYVIAVSSNRVESVCKDVAGKDKKKLILIESTVKVGTCRKISGELDLKNMAHCPHRYWGDDPVNHGVRQLRVIGAINEESLEKARKFYSRLKIPLHLCPSIEVAEMCKIAENAYRFVHISFAEELRTICEANEIDFDEVRKACNTKWNTEIPEARDGIMGTCLPKDTKYLQLLHDNTPLLDGAISTDELYKRNLKTKVRHDSQ